VDAVFLIGALTIGFVLVAVLLVFVLLRVGTLARSAVDGAELRTHLQSLSAQNERLERELRAELVQARIESTGNAQTARGELSATIGQFSQTLQAQLATMAHVQNERLSTLTLSNEQRLEAVRKTLEQRLELLRSDNAQKLEQMRATVDEKLHATLELRLGESFKQVSDRLEQVHKGLGEMQTLAVGVGDLKRVLTNVKTRGTWGEVQLGTLLAEVLTPQQFDKNVETVPNSGKRVEFAIRLPGKGDGKPCWLPVDAKFPLDDWQRLQDALERADASAADVSRKALADFLKLQARTIRDSYVSPPFTTDFAILFVPTEGLYAEMMSRPGFAELLQRDYRVTLTGPTNFLALLNSLQMGFRTLAIEQRSSEVWKVLAAVKTDFTKFGEILGRTQKKLQEASNTIDEARGKSTTIARKLRDVEALPDVDTERLLTGEPRLVYDADADVDVDAAPEDADIDPPRSRGGD
jgi:DNA recombination protein RmuC